MEKVSFNAVQNNTSLKHASVKTTRGMSFNAVQNNTSLKLFKLKKKDVFSFNAVQNNTSLKRLCNPPTNNILF